MTEMSILTFLPSDAKILFVSLGFLSGILIINLIIPILPVSGLTFALIALFTWFVSLCATFVGLHKLLQHKGSIPSSVFNKYLQYFGISTAAAPKAKKVPLKANAESIKRLSLDIDKYFISKWYCSISDDADFPTETRAFIEDVLTRLVDVVLQVNHSIVVQGLLNIYLKHLKEFRRSLKRKEKYNARIEELYRYSHICSTSTRKKTKNYFIHQLTKSLLQPFINSELWNSLPCDILVSVLARKLLRYLLDILSRPELLNYIILNALASREIKENLKLSQYGRVSIVEFVDMIEATSTEKTPDKKAVAGTTAGNGYIDKSKELQRKVEEATKQRKLLLNVDKKVVERKTHKESVVLRRRGRQMAVDGQNPLAKSPKRSDPVKIYEPKGTARTWRDSRDLACISLGQDPLDTLVGPPDSSGKGDGAKQVSWETLTKSDEVKHDSPPSAANLFNEVIHMTSMEGLKTSIKPLSDATERTLHNIKDLQEATVHNALHKIGDFQVTDTATVKKQIDPLNYLHYLPPNTLLHSSVLSNTQRLLHAQPEDEAAGMVGGILDFGRAGFRKGLRLTGLQDNVGNPKTTLANNSATARTVTKSMREQVKKKLDQLKRGESDSQEKTSSVESAESVWINPLRVDSPINYEGQILLEKTPNKSNADPNNAPPRIEDLPIPSISTEDASGTESPDPEYEETADLASSIAKLRSLLQQKSSESSLSTPALSPMPDEYKQEESGNASDVEASASEADGGVMPSFYKFCTKAASGVFSNTLNTIKTALPGNSPPENVPIFDTWKYTIDEKEPDMLIRMKRFLDERKDFCTLDKDIDTAYDALDSVDVFQQSPVLMSGGLQFEDELDDFEVKIPLAKVLVDIVCELLSDTSSPLTQEPIVKTVLMVLGPSIERKVEAELDKAAQYFAENLVNISDEESNTDVLSMNIDDYVESIESCSPDLLKYVLGKDNVRTALKLLVSSLQKSKINEDVLLQSFELVVMKLIEESTQVSPPASA